MLYNLREYHRPTDIDEAQNLLQRTTVRTAPLAGGVGLLSEIDPKVEAVVDLSGLGLDFIELSGELLHIGSMVRLQTIVEELSDIGDGIISDTAKRCAGLNIRNSATIGGMLIGGDLHSPLSVAMAALLARVKVYERAGEVPYWPDVVKEVRVRGFKGQIVTTISITVPKNGLHAGYAQIGRTPADRPIVCAVSVVYPAEDSTLATFTAIGGLQNDLFVLGHVVNSQTVIQDIDHVAATIVHERTPDAAYLDNFLGSREYRRSVAPILARRALQDALQRAGIEIS